MLENIHDAQGRSQDFTFGATEAERQRRENGGAEGIESGEDWGGLTSGVRTEHFWHI